MKSIQLSWEQERAIQTMLAGRNVFLTGNAGTGKSLVVREFVNRTDKNVAILASTGAAAKLVNGTTVHSFFQLPIGVATNENLREIDPRQAEIIEATDIIIIDEVSLLRSDQFTAIDTILRKLAPQNKKDLCLGGKQLITVGDFMQLPAFAKEPEVVEYLVSEYGGLQAFQSPVWANANFANFNLQKVFRQKNPKFMDIINSIRVGRLTYWQNVVIGERYLREDITCLTEFSYIDLLNSNCYSPNLKLSSDVINLCCTNRDAENINTTTLNRLMTLDACFYGQKIDKFPDAELPVPLRLNLKLGARVMLRTNKIHTEGYIEYSNGDIGTVIDFPGGDCVEVKLENGHVVRVEKAIWSHFDYQLIEEDGKKSLKQVEVGRYSQIPLTLSWAISIHKSQGLSLPEAHIYLGRNSCFTSGQLYVALSRVSGLKRLTVSRPVTDDDVIVDQEALRFHEGLKGAT